MEFQILWGNLNFRVHVFSELILVLSLGLIFILFCTNAIFNISDEWQKLKTQVTKYVKPCNIPFGTPGV